MSRPHTGRWLEELTPGLVIEHAIRRTITEADNVLFTSITMNPAWIHLDFDYAQRETSYGKPLVNSMLTVAMVVMAAASTFISRSITKPIQGLVAVLRDISEGQGDLTVRIPVTGKDELGELASCFNTFLVKLQKIIAELNLRID